MCLPGQVIGVRLRPKKFSFLGVGSFFAPVRRRSGFDARRLFRPAAERLRLALLR